MSISTTQEAAIQIDPDARAMWRDALRNIAIGWEIVVALGVGYLLGWALDRWLHTSPYLKIVGLVLGVAAAIKALVRVVREYRQSVGPDDPVDENAPPRPAMQRRRHRRHHRRDETPVQPPTDEEK
jgi:F0F1-type ATP synthase assembly protein I